MHVQTHEGDHSPLLVSVEHARRALGGISRRTIYRLLDAQRLRSVKIGRRRMVVRSSLASIASAQAATFAIGRG